MCATKNDEKRKEGEKRRKRKRKRKKIYLLFDVFSTRPEDNKDEFALEDDEADHHSVSIW